MCMRNHLRWRSPMAAWFLHLAPRAPYRSTVLFHWFAFRGTGPLVCECIRVKSNHHHYNLMGTQRHQQMHIPQKGNVEILTNHFDFSTLDKYHPPKHWKHPLQGRHLHFLRHFSRYRGHHFAHSTCIRRGVSIVQLGREGEAATLGNRHEIRFIIYGPMCKRTATFCRRTCCFLCGTSS